MSHPLTDNLKARDASSSKKVIYKMRCSLVGSVQLAKIAIAQYKVASSLCRRVLQLASKQVAISQVAGVEFYAGTRSPVTGKFLSLQSRACNLRFEKCKYFPWRSPNK